MNVFSPDPIKYIYLAISSGLAILLRGISLALLFIFLFLSILLSFVFVTPIG